MARIRSIKPEFFTDEKVGECSPNARLLFIGTWVFADDHGNLDRSARQLKAQVFPYDTTEVEPLLQELLRSGMLREYEVDSRKFLHINGFGDHQKIDKPSKPRVPLPEDSPNASGVVDEDSTTPRSGEEGSGKERKGGEREAARVRAFATPGLDVKVFEHWEAYRVRIRKPLTEHSYEANARKIAAAGERQAELVALSTENDWQGLFPERLNGTHKGGSPAKPKGAWDRLVEANPDG